MHLRSSVGGLGKAFADSFEAQSFGTAEPSCDDRLQVQTLQSVFQNKFDLRGCHTSDGDHSKKVYYEDK